MYQEGIFCTKELGILVNDKSNDKTNERLHFSLPYDKHGVTNNGALHICTANAKSFLIVNYNDG